MSGPFRFKVISFDPNREAEAIVADLVELAPELERYVKARAKEHEVVSLVARREESVPIDAESAFLLVTVTAALTAVGQGFFGRLGEDIYEFFKSRIKGGRIDRE